MVAWTPAWLLGDLHGCLDTCMVAWTPAWLLGNLHGCLDTCMVAWKPAWLLGNHGFLSLSFIQDLLDERHMGGGNEVNTFVVTTTVCVPYYY